MAGPQSVIINIGCFGSQQVAPRAQRQPPSEPAATVLRRLPRRPSARRQRRWAALRGPPLAVAPRPPPPPPCLHPVSMVLVWQPLTPMIRRVELMAAPAIRRSGFGIATEGDGRFSKLLGAPLSGTLMFRQQVRQQCCSDQHRPAVLPYLHRTFGDGY